MNKQKKIILFILCPVLLSFTWPMKNVKITSTFGESRYDHFHDGIDIISHEKEISPAENGELVFFWDKSLFPTENYPGGGNYKILKHNSGYYSIYMHLKDNPDTKYTYSSDDILGEMGNTGHSFGPHLHFSLLNINSMKSINPLIVFSPIPDTKNPVIGDAFIRVDDNYFRIRDNEKIRLTRHHALLIEMYDSMNQTGKLGIFRLQVKINGKNIFNCEYSEISLLKNRLTIYGKSFQDLFDIKGYYKIPDIQYKEGINDLFITATDYSGNISTKKISFNVNLDIQQTPR